MLVFSTVGLFSSLLLTALDAGVPSNPEGATVVLAMSLPPPPSTEALIGPLTEGTQLELMGEDVSIRYEFSQPVQYDQVEVELCEPVKEDFFMPPYPRAQNKELNPCRAQRDTSDPPASKYCFTDGFYVAQPWQDETRVLDVRLRPTKKLCVKAVRLLLHGKAIPLKVPRLLGPASVTASSSLRGRFEVENLFDGTLDLAWAAPAKARQPVLRFAFGQTTKLSGLILWNGYQLNDTLFDANARIKSLTVSADDVLVEAIPVASQQGAQELRFSKPVEAKTLALRIDERWGPAGADLAVSELRFLGADGTQLTLDTSATQRQAATDLRAKLGNDANAVFSLTSNSDSISINLNALGWGYEESYGSARFAFLSNGVFSISGNVCTGRCAGDLSKGDSGCTCENFATRGLFDVSGTADQRKLELAGSFTHWSSYGCPGEANQGSLCKSHLFSQRLTIEPAHAEVQLRAGPDVSCKKRLPFVGLPLRPSER